MQGKKGGGLRFNGTAEALISCPAQNPAQKGASNLTFAGPAGECRECGATGSAPGLEIRSDAVDEICSRYPRCGIVWNTLLLIYRDAQVGFDLESIASM